MQARGAAGIEPAQLEGPKAHAPVAVGQFGEAHTLTGDGLVDEHVAPAPLDLPVVPDAPHLDRVGILERGQASGYGRGDGAYCVAGGCWPSASCGRSVLYMCRNRSKARC